MFRRLRPDGEPGWGRTSDLLIKSLLALLTGSSTAFYLFPIMPISPKFIVSPGFPWFPVVSRDISCPCLPGAYPREQLTMRHRLTAAFVTKAAPVADKDRTVFWDTTQPGFGLMVTRNGARSYVVQYR